MQSGSDVCLNMPSYDKMQPIFKMDTIGRFEMNLHVNLLQIIRETKYLDSLGFKLGEMALSVTLQEDKYQFCVESLQNMIQVCSKMLLT